MRRVIFILCMLNLAYLAHGQDFNEKKAFKEAKKAFEHDYYKRASGLFYELIQHSGENAEYLFFYGACELMSFSYEDGLRHLERAYQLDPKVDKYIDYWLGRAYHLNYKFNDAVKYYNNHLNVLKPKDTRRIDAEKLVLEAEYGYDLCTRPQNYLVKNAGNMLNSEFSEHSPVVSQDGNMIIFTSRRYTEEHTDEHQDETGSYYEKIYISYQDDRGNWSKPRPIKGIDEKNQFRHQATVELYDNDTKLLIYRDGSKGDLYVSEKINDSTWTEATALKNVNSAMHEADAFVSFDGQQLYLASSMGNLEDNLDLYVCQKEDNGWSKPKYLGDKINSDYDENSPFVSKDGMVLYFSSKGHTSMGGYDVFRSDYDTVSNSWGLPQNVGHPINTPGDDIYFYYSDKNSWTGYFSSYRAGGKGEKDLYKVTFVPNVFIDGLVTDVSTGNVVPNATINFVTKPDENATDAAFAYQDITTTFTEDPTGAYDVNVLSNTSYEIIVMMDGDTAKVDSYDVPMLQEGDDLYYTHNIEIDLSKEEILVVNDPEITDPEVNDPEVIEADPEVVINDPEVIETDPEVVINDPEIIETDPEVVINDPEILVEDPEVIEEIEDTIKYFNLREEDVKTGCRVVLRNVYFEFDKAKLKPESFEELDNLYCWLTNRDDIKIEISGHTDAIGSENYNLTLSHKRAQAVVDYLVNKGISSDRLIAQGYGETRPIATNDDEVDGRQLNRRTEFEIKEVRTLAYNP